MHQCDNPIMTRTMWTMLVAAILVPGAVLAQAPDVAALLKEGSAQLEQGHVDAAVEQFEAAVKANPQKYEAQDGLGRALDLQGRYADARPHLERALALAPEDKKNQALATLAISYAFQSRPEDAARFYQRAFDAQMQAKDPASAAGTANALGRVYLESGKTDKARQWYQTGYETSRRLSHRVTPQQRLWDMRWHHALARIAARRGKRALALQHAATVKRILDAGGNDSQRPAYPYLIGYIDFYTRHYREAIASLAKADQSDVFILGLLAQSYQKVGDQARAREYFEKVMASGAHSINMAFSRPQARAYLAKHPR